MSSKVGKQDFEAYADHKPFNYVTNPVWEDIIQGILKQNQTKKDARECSVLDYGCGDGKLFPNLIRMGFSSELIQGIEVSETRIQRCKSIGFANAQYLPLNQKLSFEDKSFDIINYMEVIEHVPSSEIDFYLGEIARVLKSDGTAIITTPNYPIKRVIDVYYAIKKKQWSRLKDDPTHVTFYNHQSLRVRLEKYFKNVEIRPYKIGPFYSVIKSPFFLHKIVALCSQPK